MAHELRFRQRVTRVVVEKGRAAGVETDEGERIAADAVIWNGDAAALGDGSAGPEASRAVAATPPAERSLSALTWAMTARVEGFPLVRHNVFFSRDYRAEFDDLFGRSRLPGGPTVYVCAQDRDEAAGPVESHAEERLFCLVNAPTRPADRPLTDAEITTCEEASFRMLEQYGLRITKNPGSTRRTTPEDFATPLSVDPRGALWPGDARLESVVRAGGIQDPAAGSLSGGGQRPSWTRRADGGAVGPPGGDAGDAGPCFDQEVVPGGYAWWYVDAISDDGQHGLTVIAFVGSVFSPYYAWAGRRDPLDHCAFNVALYGPRASRWAMTERRRSAVTRSRDTLAIGQTTASWERGALVLDVQERGAPIPRRIQGRITVHPEAINPLPFVLEERGRHWWRPLAPRARVTVEMDAPALRWQGSGYLDQNAGAEPIEQAFSQWTWSRAATRDGATILYDAVRRREPPLSLALAFDRNAHFDKRRSPPSAPLRHTRWRLARTTRADEGRASAIRSFEDTPFYSRGLVAHSLFGEDVESMHESLSLDRVANPLVRLMLPFRMPRR